MAVWKGRRGFSDPLRAIPPAMLGSLVGGVAACRRVSRPSFVATVGYGRTMRACLVCLVVLGLFGCAESHHGDLPFPADTREIDLDDRQYQQLCEWWKAQRGWPEREWILCLDGGAGTRFRGPEICVLGRNPPAEIPACSLTVGQWAACLEAQPDGCPPYAEVCIRPPECIAGGRAGFLVPRARALPARLTPGRSGSSCSRSPGGSPGRRGRRRAARSSAG